MQPYFFPYLGYFHLINIINKWIVFDTVQYIKRGWMNRNRILHPTSCWQYIIVPLKKHSTNTPINEIQIASHIDWKSDILDKLSHYKRQAPLFEETMSFVKDCLSNNENSLARLNVSILEKVCTRLDIKFDYSYLSEMNLDLGPIEGPGDWSLHIAEAIGAREYVNAPSGAYLFDPKKFEERGIKLTIQKFENLEYNCGQYEFIPALSIIDVFMWNSCNKIKKHLNQ